MLWRVGFWRGFAFGRFGLGLFRWECVCPPFSLSSLLYTLEISLGILAQGTTSRGVGCIKCTELKMASAPNSFSKRVPSLWRKTDDAEPMIFCQRGQSLLWLTVARNSKAHPVAINKNKKARMRYWCETLLTGGASKMQQRPACYGAKPLRASHDCVFNNVAMNIPDAVLFQMQYYFRCRTISKASDESAMDMQSCKRMQRQLFCGWMWC